MNVAFWNIYLKEKTKMQVKKQKKYFLFLGTDKD